MRDNVAILIATFHVTLKINLFDVFWLLFQFKNNLIKHKKRFTEIEFVVQNLYEDKIKGIIDERRFKAMAESYDNDQKNSKNK